MAKPTDIKTRVPRCPIDGRPGWALWWLPQDSTDRRRLQLAIHHGMAPDGNDRNDFHWCDEFDESGNILFSYRADPLKAPGDNPRIRKYLGL